MVHQNVIHLGRRDLFAAAIDDLFETPGNGEMSLFIEHALVSGVEPAMGEGLVVGFRVALITGGDVVPANDEC